MNPCLVYLHIETSIQIYFTKAMVNCLYIFVYQPGCKLNRVSLYDGLFSRELFGRATASDAHCARNFKKFSSIDGFALDIRTHFLCLLQLFCLGRMHLLFSEEMIASVKCRCVKVILPFNIFT